MKTRTLKVVALKRAVFGVHKNFEMVELFRVGLVIVEIPLRLRGNGLTYDFHATDLDPAGVLNLHMVAFDFWMLGRKTLVHFSKSLDRNVLVQKIVSYER